MTSEEKLNNMFADILIHKISNPNHMILSADDPETLQLGWICDQDCKQWTVHVSRMKIIFDSKLPILQFINSLFKSPPIKFNNIKPEDYPEEIKRLLNLKAFW